MLKELPETLDKTYERVLRDINRANRDHARRLLQCLTVAIRPLRVAELAEVLALDFGTDTYGGTPKLNPDWRWEDQKQVALSTCSSLISIVDEKDYQVVQFSHFSVKEYLTSSRLAVSSADVSHFHILPEPAHTILAKSCLCVLLQLDEHADRENVEKSSPLAQYAAEHWVDHVKFEQVSSHLREAMEDLFDPVKPCFSAWLRVHDIDVERETHLYQFSSPYWGHAAAPLYYAALCEFHDLAEHLVIKYPQQVNSIGGRYVSPLAAALSMGDLNIAQLLYDHGAYVDVQDSSGRTPLYSASRHPEIVEWLLSHGADPHFRSYDSCLHIAAQYGRVEASRILLQRKVDQNSLTSHYYDRTPLHAASKEGHLDVVRLLLKHGVDVNVQDNNRSTTLHLALDNGHVGIAKLLLERGVNVNAQNNRRSTALHLASKNGGISVTQLLFEHNANANALDGDGRTPLHLASQQGYISFVRLLLEHGVNVNARDNKRFTALHLASGQGHVNIARLLLEHGVDVNAQNTDGGSTAMTAMHLALEKGHIKVAQLLLEHGVDVKVQDKRRSTALHLASEEGRMSIVQLLLQRGADVNALNSSGWTPLHLSSARGHQEKPRVLASDNTRAIMSIIKITVNNCH